MGLNDNRIMPYGQHKGSKMVDVPATYLVWLYNNNKLSQGWVKVYVLENLEVLKEQIRLAR